MLFLTAKRGGSIGIRKEANRFHNMILIVREMCFNSKMLKPPYSIANNLGRAFYLNFPLDG